MPWLPALLLLLLCGTAAAQQAVALQGMLGRKALLIIDGAPPKAVAPGETHQGVTVLSTAGDQAWVEFGGQRQQLRVGEAPASVGGSGHPRGNTIVLPASSGGHFFAQGSINGRATQFVVDTGASSVAIGLPEARRLGIDWQAGRPGRSATANGVVTTWQVKLASVRIGDVEVHEVDAAVLPQEMPYVLLGNSFLNRFQMRRDHHQLVLQRRY